MAAFIAGISAPPAQPSGYAGAIISGGDDTAGSNVKNVKGTAVSVATSPGDIGAAMALALGLSDAVAA